MGISYRRLSKIRLKLGLTLLGLMAVGSGAFAVLLRDDAERPTPSVAKGLGVAPVSSDQEGAYTQRSAGDPATLVKVPEPTVAPVTTSRPTRPTCVKDVLDQRAFATVADLAEWVRDRGLDPRIRYASLRRLEEVSVVDAVTSAIAVLQPARPEPAERSSLLHLNAIALLVRGGTSEAQITLAKLDERSRRLAGALFMEQGR